MIHYSLINVPSVFSTLTVADGDIIHTAPRESVGVSLGVIPAAVLASLSRAMRVRLCVVKKFITSGGSSPVAMSLSGNEQAVLYTLLRFASRVKRNSSSVKAGHRWSQSFSYTNCNSGRAVIWTHVAERVFSEII